MTQRNLLGKLKVKAFGAVDKTEKVINTAVKELDISEMEKNDRERTLLQIKSGQYFLLGVATLALLFAEGCRPGIILAFSALFFEKAVAALAKDRFKNESLAGYISDNYSKLTHLSDVFNPVIYGISDDCKDINNLVIKVRASR